MDANNNAYACTCVQICLSLILFKQVESSSNGVPTVVHKLCGKCKQLLKDGQECSNHDCKAIAEVVKDHIFFELPLD